MPVLKTTSPAVESDHPKLVPCQVVPSSSSKYAFMVNLGARFRTYACKSRAGNQPSVMFLTHIAEYTAINGFATMKRYGRGSRLAGFSSCSHSSRLRTEGNRRL